MQSPLQREEEARPPPDDAGETRGRHFGALARDTRTLAIAWTVAITALIVVGGQAGWALGGAAAGAVVLATLGVVWAVATRRAADDFFAAYAASRRLQRARGRGRLPPVTPLLRRGDRHYTRETLSGTLPGGLAGTLAHYTYEERAADSRGDEQTTHYDFTVALAQLPETARFLGELAAERRAGLRFLDSAEDAFRTRRRVELESALADRKFEIFIGGDDDLNHARQVFSPSFVVWLAEQAPDGIAFELSAGALVVSVRGHLKKAAELDGFCAAAGTIAHRLREEAAE